MPGQWRVRGGPSVPNQSGEVHAWPPENDKERLSLYFPKSCQEFFFYISPNETVPSFTLFCFVVLVLC